MFNYMDSIYVCVYVSVEGGRKPEEGGRSPEAGIIVVIMSGHHRCREPNPGPLATRPLSHLSSPDVLFHFVLI